MEGRGVECYKDGAKRKTYSVSIKSDVYLVQITFEKVNTSKKGERTIQN